MDRAEQRTVLEAFSRTLNKEAHNLRQWPELLWQQLYNRLQWGDELVVEVIKPELMRRSKPGAKSWFHLLSCVRESEGFIRILEHNEPVQWCAFSPDGEILASLSERKLKLWDWANARELATYKERSGWSKKCAFTPDGGVIASGGGEIRLRDIATGKELAVLSGGVPFSFSPDGKKIILQGSEQCVEIWDVEKGCLANKLGRHDFSVTSCTFSSDGSLAASSGGGIIRLYDTSTGQEVALLDGSRGAVETIAFSPDGRLIASGGYGFLILWEVASKTEIATIELGDNVITCCTFFPDGQMLIAGGGGLDWDDEGIIKIFEVDSRREKKTLVGHSMRVNACGISPGGEVIASASEDETVRLWDVKNIESKKKSVYLGDVSGVVTSYDFDSEGKRLVCGNTDGMLSVFDVPMMTEVCILGGKPHTAEVCAYSPDGQYILSGGENGQVILWSISSGKEVATTTSCGGTIQSCAFSPSGKVVALGAAGTLELWEIESQQEPHVLGVHDGDVYSCAFSPSGNLLASQGTDLKIKVWDISRQKEILALEGHKRDVSSYPFSPDGNFIVASFEGPSLDIWNLNSRQSVVVLEGHSGFITSFSFNSNGQLLLSGSEDGTLRIWDLGTGKTIVLLEETSPVEYCTFSPDNKFILSGQKKLFKLWDATTRECVAYFPSTGFFQSCAFGPIGNVVVCKSTGGQLYVAEAVSLKSLLRKGSTPSMSTEGERNLTTERVEREQDKAADLAAEIITCPKGHKNYSGSKWCGKCGMELQRK